MKNRYLELDIIRAVSILLVIICHIDPVPTANDTNPIIASIFGFIAKGGWIGVDLFFVLSGYLISGLIFDEYIQNGSVKIGRFLLRRGFKIYPSFYFFVFVSILFPLRGYLPDAKQILYECVYLQNYLPGIWGHTWSLAVEEHFYLLFALLVFILLRFSKNQSPFRAIPKVFVIIASLCLILRFLEIVLIPYNNYIHYLPTHLRIDSLLFGVLISYLHHFYPVQYMNFANRYKWFLLFTGIILFLPAFFTNRSQILMTTFGYVFYYFGSGMLVMATSAIKVRKNSVSRCFAYIGQRSYTIYLWHLSIRYFLLPLLQLLTGYWLTPMANVFAFILLSLGLGILASNLIEMPFLKLRDMVVPSPKYKTANSQQSKSYGQPSEILGSKDTRTLPG